MPRPAPPLEEPAAGARSAGFRRNPRLDELLAELNSLLAPAERGLLERHERPRHPAVLIVGCPRSGTTLGLQWLGASGFFTWPSNFIARFYGAPAIGARIQQLLFDPGCDYRGELGLGAGAAPAAFSSTLGKTRGPLQPNEFWHFWRRFFTFGADQRLGAAQLEQVDSATFLAELAALEAVENRPLAMKALILNWNLPFLANLLPKAIFVHLHRDPIHCMASILRARERFCGSPRRWWSFRPPEYTWLRELTPELQVAGQVICTERAVRAGLRSLAPQRRLQMSYEELCTHPEASWERLIARLAEQGWRPAGVRAEGPLPHPPNTTPLSREKYARLESAYEEITRRAQRRDSL